MCELREDTFSGNKNEDAHDHIDRVLSIVGLFNILGVSKDATAKQLEDIHNFKQEGDESLYHAWERYNDLLYKCPTHDINSHQKHDGTTSRNIGSSSSDNGLAALVNKLDNLGQDMKKLKESVHAIQVGCQICEGPHLDKDYPLNKEVKQVEEVRYGEFGRRMPFNGNNGGKFRVGPPRYYTKTDNRPPYGERSKINTRNQSASLRNLETQMEQLTKEIHSDKTLNSSSEQIKTVTIDHETSRLNKLHGLSFMSGPGSDTPEVLQHQLPLKDLNPGSFTLPCTISKFNFYAMADLDMSKKAPLGIVENVLVKIDKFLFPSDFIIIDNTPSETTIIGRPFLATIHVEIDTLAESNNQIDYEESGNWDNRSPNLDDQKSKKRKIKLDEIVPRAHFYNPIKQNIKEQTQMWPSYDPKKMCDGGVEIRGVSKTGNLRFWWHNHEFENDECEEIGIEDKDYHPPEVQVETFKIKKYSFEGGQSFICVTKDLDNVLPLGRKNGSEFKEMIRKEVENNKT
ncbi:reverse transcriptase domain-containing protein [Tanacetum coccineum]